MLYLIIFLANYRKWLRSVTHYTASLIGKRKFETLAGEKLIFKSTPTKSAKNRKMNDGPAMGRAVFSVNVRTTKSRKLTVSDTFGCRFY